MITLERKFRSLGLWLALVPVWVAPVHAAVVLSIGQNFTGTTLGIGSTAVPADANGSAGPNHYVELINGRFTVYLKANGAAVKTMTDLSFWIQAGVPVASGWDVTDPRIVFDPNVQRWFASQVDYDPTGMANSNHFLLAISATADPTSTWRGFSISTSPGLNDFGDFPTLGLDSQGVYLSADMFDTANNSVGASLLSIPKSDLVAASPTIANRTWLGIRSDHGDIVQPVACVDGSETGALLATAGLGFDYNVGNFVTNKALVGSTIHNAAGPGSATLSASNTFTVPPFTAPDDPTQPDGTQNLDDGDARLSAMIYGVGGVIYVVHHTQVFTPAASHAALRWYRLNASNFALLESGTISDPNLDLFYPSIAASTNGTVVIACNGSSISTFVSCYAVAGNTVNGTTTFGSLVLLKRGAASYQNVDPSGFSRWGDYSSTCADPSDPTRFWTIQMYPSGSSTWSTQITELRTGPLVLSGMLSGNQIQLSWSASAAGFNLQSTSVLASPSSWSPVTQSRATNGNVISVLVPASGPSQFFRLSNGP